MSAPKDYDAPRWRYRLFDDIERGQLRQRLRVAIASAVATGMTLVALAFFALCAFTTVCHA